jgi:hypothetical protein
VLKLSTGTALPLSLKVIITITKYHTELSRANTMWSRMAVVLFVYRVYSINTGSI